MVSDIKLCIKKLNKFLFLSLVIVFLSLTACSRPQAEKSKVSIVVPKAMNSNKLQNALGTQNVLEHIAINVTTAGSSKPLFIKNFKACESTVDCDFSFDIDKGSNRLIQVLAVYKSSDNKMLFYYGDKTVDIAKNLETLSIDIFQQGSSTEVNGRISGRYISPTGTIPSGKINIKYKPEGKPSLIVDEAIILNGWFNVFALKDIALTYELPNGELLFGQSVNLDSSVMAPKNSLMKMSIPKHKRCFDATCANSENENPSIFIWGYFGNTLSSKMVCKANNLTLTKLRKMDNSILSINASLVPPNDLFSDISGYVYLQGGSTADSNGCPSSIDSQIYQNYLFIDSLLIDGNGNDAVAGFAPPLAAIPNSSNSERRVLYFDEATNAISGKLLPELDNMIQSVEIYKRVGADVSGLQYDKNNFSCDSQTLKDRNFELSGAGPITNLTFSVASNITATNKATGVVAVVCFKSTNNIMPFGFFMRSENLSSSIINPTPVISNLAHHFDLVDGYTVKIPGGCYATEIKLKDIMGNQVNLTGTNSLVANVNVAAYTSGPTLFADSSCSANIGLSHNLTFDVNNITNYLYYSPGISGINFNITSAKVDIPLNVGFTTLGGSPLDPTLHPSLFLYLTSASFGSAGPAITWDFITPNYNINNNNNFVSRYMGSSSPPNYTNVDGSNVIQFTGTNTSEFHHTAANLETFTTVMLVKIPSNPQTGCIASFGLHSTDSYICIKQSYSGQTHISIYNNIATYQDTIVSPGWHMISLRRDASIAGQNKFSLSVDNAASFSYAIYSGSLGNIPIANIYIGNTSGFNFSTQFHIAEFYTFNREVSLGESGMLYNYLKNKYPSFNLP